MTPTFVGLDGIRNGWVAVYLSSDGCQRFASGKSALLLLTGPFDRAMIDMPIGLPTRGYRQCDVEARALVGSRVFLGARQGIWKFRTLAEANAHYWSREGRGRGVSIQLFGIRDKLRELNERPMAPRVFEAHPELIFRRLAGRVLTSKKTAEGRAARVELLKANGIVDVELWLTQRRGTGIGGNDLIDACACALAARDSACTLPANGDGSGQAEIWY
jgi:predicted RNase H-like nuclease